MGFGVMRKENGKGDENWEILKGTWMRSCWNEGKDLCWDEAKSSLPQQQEKGKESTAMKKYACQKGRICSRMHHRIPNFNFFPIFSSFLFLPRIIIFFGQTKPKRNFETNQIMIARHLFLKPMKLAMWSV